MAAPSEASSEAPFWSREAAELAAALGSGPGGLTEATAGARLIEAGANRLEEAGETQALRLLLRQFASPLVLILVFAAAVSLVLHQWVDASIILSIVVGSALLGFSQEYRASAAVEALKRRLALTARVVRDGSERSLPFAEVVPGDLLLLSAGNLVPADGLVLKAQDFLVSEATLTGESYPVEKRPGRLASATPIAHRSNAVFLGASVRSGTAKVLAVETGRRTEFGRIAARLRARPPETDFARGVRRFGYLLMRVMTVVVLFVLAANLLLERPVIDSLLFAVALAVGISPELLPAIVSITLSSGARSMSRRGVIVRRLEAIENLGSMEVLCTDKTGTLTEGSLVLQATLDPQGRPSEAIRQLAFLNAAFETGIENPLDAAILAAGREAGLGTAGFVKVDEIPYDFQRRRLTIVLASEDRPGEHRLITKGAFAEVLAACTALEEDGCARPLDEERRAALQALFRTHGEQGFRVLALATRRLPAQVAHGREEERDMVFGGFLVFHDPPKAGAAEAIRALARRGVAIKVVSGDNRFVTAHLADAIGLDPGSMLTGEDMSGMKEEALWNRAQRTDLFVEIDPQQKERIVRALQQGGRSVGYLGDGINDAPALRAADVGISVESAVDVARESADIILLTSDLAVLCRGLEDGRRTFANTLKYIAITISANFGNMVSMALATPLLPFLPLAPKQILLNNFLSEGPSIAIAGDNVDGDRIARPARWSIRAIQRFMIVFGLVSSVFDLLTFAVLLLVFRAEEATFQTAWFVISVLTELAVVLVLRTRLPMLRSRPGRTLLWSTLLVAALTLALPYLGGLAEAFGFVPLPLRLVVLSLGIVAAYLLTSEWAKHWYWRRWPEG